MSLMSRLLAARVSLRLEGDRLAYRSPGGRLPPDLQAELRARRSEIVAWLSAGVERSSGVGRAPEPFSGEPLPRTSGAGDVEIGPSQRGIWLQEELAPERATYNVPLFVRMRGWLAWHAFEQALGEVVRHQGVLRARYIAGRGWPQMEVVPYAPEPLTAVDLSGLTPDARATALIEALEREVHRPFDLCRGPVRRVACMRIGPEEHVVLLSVHHLSFDGWSLNILARELELGYEALLRGDAAELPALAFEYDAFARWQRRNEERPEWAAKLESWKLRLHDLPEPSWPMRAASAPELSARAVRASEVFSPEPMRGLARLGQVTPFVVACSVLQVVVSRRSSQLDFAIGTDHAGRGLAGAESVMGMFVNQLVLRADLAGDPTFSQLMRRVHERVGEALGLADVGFDRVLAALGRGNDFERPIFRVKLVLQPETAGLQLSGLECEPLAGPSSAAKFDLILNVFERGGEMVGVVECRECCLSAASAAEFLAEFMALSRFVAERPEARLQDMWAMLERAERERRRRERTGFADHRRAVLRQLQTRNVADEA